MEQYRKVDEKIGQGYDLLLSHQTVKGCDVLLDAWEDIKNIMAEEKIEKLSTLQGKYEWTDFLSNYVQELEAELYNAAINDPRFLPRRIQYGEELLKVCDDDALIIENIRRSIADSHFALGDKEECDRLYQMWLAQDPNWGWGHIGWSDCYHFGTKNIPPDNEKAEEIIKQALKEPDLRDRADVLERAIEIYTALNKDQQAAELGNELLELKAAASKSRPNYRQVQTVPNTPITVIKIGRNEPCPCGSGKKYKKCCGG